MVFASLLFLLPLSALTSALSRTYRDTDPLSGRPLDCDRCPPGTYLLRGCTSTRKSECAPCPGGSFTELWNHIPKCLRCGVCGHNEVVKSACAPDADCTCECKEGYYYKESYDMCVAHRKCPAGEGVLSEGSPHNDTVCQVCPSGSFSDAVSARLRCSEHRSCDPGQVLLLRGSTWHDDVCARCDELRSTDGAHYLRQLLPALLLQHVSVRWLHRVLQRLPGATEPPGRALPRTERLKAWAASATATQIRQLPKLLNRAGADHAGTKLLHKLQSIDGSLHQLCPVGNQVEDVL